MAYSSESRWRDEIDGHPPHTVAIPRPARSPRRPFARCRAVFWSRPVRADLARQGHCEPPVAPPLPHRPQPLDTPPSGAQIGRTTPTTRPPPPPSPRLP